MDRLEKCTMAAVAALLAWQMFVPPVVGLANNGDFAKVIGVFNLAAPAQDEFKYATTVYTFDPTQHYWSRFCSSEILLAGAAIGLNAVFSKSGTFDLRWIGAIHAALFLAAFALLLPLLRGLARWKRVLISACLVLVFSDAMYATLFNSFFMDAATFVFFCLAAAFFLRGMRWGVLVSVLLMLTAKTQHVPLAAPIAVLLVSRFWRAHRVFTGAALAAILAAALIGWKGVPPEYGPIGYYNMIFFRLLPDYSRDPGRDLAELGLDDSYRRHTQTHSYTPNSPMSDPEFVREFSRRTGYGRLGWFFVKHPAIAWRAIRDALGEGGRQRPQLGNFDRSAGLPASSETRSFVAWSGLKQAVFFHRGPRYFWFFVAVSAAVVLLALTGVRAWLLPVAALFAMGLIEVLVSSLADCLDPVRHLFLFNALVDMLVVALVAAAVSWRAAPHERWNAWAMRRAAARQPAR